MMSVRPLDFPCNGGLAIIGSRGTAHEPNQPESRLFRGIASADSQATTAAHAPCVQSRELPRDLTKLIPQRVQARLPCMHPQLMRPQKPRLRLPQGWLGRGLSRSDEAEMRARALPRAVRDEHPRLSSVPRQRQIDGYAGLRLQHRPSRKCKELKKQPQEVRTVGIARLRPGFISDCKWRGSCHAGRDVKHRPGMLAPMNCKRLASGGRLLTDRSLKAGRPPPERVLSKCDIGGLFHEKQAWRGFQRGRSELARRCPEQARGKAQELCERRAWLCGRHES